MLGVEKDACGVGFVADVKGRSSRRVVDLALQALARHAHRGAVAADGKTGDGAGLLIATPKNFLAEEYLRLTSKALPTDRPWAVGCIFLPLRQAGARQQVRQLLQQALQEQGIECLAWRDVPLALDCLGPNALARRPHIQHLFVAGGADFEQALFRARREAEREWREAGLEATVVSLSSHSLVYKGLCRADQLAQFFPDLQSLQSSVAVFHQRYSTNTFPSWHLAQPFRLIAHNGEFNTLQANQKWMQAREAALGQTLPVISPGNSDSGAFDNVLEFLLRSGNERELLPCLLMMLPEIWENVAQDGMPSSWRSFYRYLSCLMEPWEGPAALTFFDGRWVGAMLDRNGLRPLRTCLLREGLMVASSEAGCIDIEESQVVRRSMLGPGEVIAIDLKEGRLLSNHELKQEVAARFPYEEWISERERGLPKGELLESWLETPSRQSLQRRLLAFGYNHEEEVTLLRPMAQKGFEPVGSMGDDTPPAALSGQTRPLFHYFRQRFAQVTNPPLDPLRERLVMSLRSWVGRRANVLVEAPEVCRLVELPSPVLSTQDFRRLLSLSPSWLSHIVLATTWSVQSGPQALEERLEQLCQEAEEAVRQGANLVVLYDGGVNPFRAPLPSLLALSAVHHRLLERGLRLNASLVVASGEPREVHHFACLLGYGADLVFPYLALDSLSDGQEHFLQAINTGLLKVMAKMGISLMSSYRAGQVFESLGLSQSLVDRYFPDTPASLGGLTLAQLAERQVSWHQAAFADQVESGWHPGQGFYKFKKEGELHRFSPPLAKLLREVAQGQRTYPEYAQQTHSQGPLGLRDLLGLVRHRQAIPLSEVEPVQAILSRFSTGAMSFGSLSQEAHEALSLAMNSLGAMSNCGEGGEAPERYSDQRNSAIKQVASGRFGVTPGYLISAQELQIKMAQGSKPGEGGQIPGSKVSEEIARVRHTLAGIDLISPPPHHDIYSIEDLAQLIHDLKRFHPSAFVSVKLVSQEGVGTVAAGVAKGFADVIQISGCDGGTGASPLSSIKFAGMPWEMGLAQAQQVLVKNLLRDKVRLRVDGGMRNGRDVVIAALLGADEYAFGTAALIAQGCLMARACHNNTCPVGIASQDPKLRAKFPGRPEHIVTFLRSLAEEVREILASLGVRSLQEVIGRTELLEQISWGPSAGHLDLSPLLERASDDFPRSAQSQLVPHQPRHGRDLDAEVISWLEQDRWDVPEIDIQNTDRAFGTRLSGYLLKRFGRQGHDCQLPAGQLQLRLRGSAGQSLGAFGVSALHLELRGQANDYVGKGLHGGQISIRPQHAPLSGPDHFIAGNTLLYGATGGCLFAAGRVGQRLAVRNSGAVAVVEGAGEHACEYMTGGLVIILGNVGRNLGAAMTGGQVFLYDPEGQSLDKLNLESVVVGPVSSESELLRGWLQRHQQATQSPLAGRLLADWQRQLPFFRQITPKNCPAPSVLPALTGTP
jgi:glutamate synthase (ferredoxin)